MKCWIGGYSEEIHTVGVDVSTGAMTIESSAPAGENASFLVYSAQRKALYATVETGYAKGESGIIGAYRAAQDGSLSEIGSAPSCGTGPCHMVIDEDRGLLAAANYGGVNFGVLSLLEDGTPDDVVACVTHSGSSIRQDRQGEPHPHATVISPDGRYLMVCDLGTDQVFSYPADEFLSADAATSSPGPAAVFDATPGAGPRHLVFSAQGNHVYVVNELSNTVTACRFSNVDGELSSIQEISTLPDGFTDGTAAEIQLHPNGQFLYASNRGHDSIAVFQCDGSSGLLAPLGHIPSGGEEPRHFCFDPTGRWLIVSTQKSNRVESFAVGDDGMAEPTGNVLTVKAPSCVEFMLD